MKSLLTIVLLLTSLVYTFGQIEIQPGEKEDIKTSDYYLFSAKHGKVKKLHLALINTIDHAFYSRLWLDDQVVEIWTNDYQIFQGNIINYTATYEKINDKNGRRKPSKYFSDKIIMDTSDAHKTYNLLQAIESIPTEDSIKGWSRGCDGFEYYFETLKQGTYCYKKYWSPYAQDSSLIEANQIHRFLFELNQLYNSDSLYHEFFKTLKPGKYSDGSICITIKYSKKQGRKLMKEFPGREYLDSISDSLNKYLYENLTQIIFPDGVPYTTESYIYHLRFSPENKIARIKSECEYYCLADRIDALKMKRKVRKALKHIDLSFVRSEIPFIKTFQYFQDGISIY